jgi:hypothetical protein
MQPQHPGSGAQRATCSTQHCTVVAPTDPTLLSPKAAAARLTADAMRRSTAYRSAPMGSDLVLVDLTH